MALVASLALPATAADAPPGIPPDGALVVTLGDSFASGEGAPARDDLAAQRAFWASVAPLIGWHSERGAPGEAHYGDGALRLTFVPGAAFRAPGAGGSELRLAYSFESPERLAEGARRLGRALARVGT